MSRSQLTRRSFIRLSGAGLGAAAVSNLLTACGQVLGVGVTDSEISLDGLGDPQWVQVRRPDDLVVVDFGLVNLKRVTLGGQVRLVKRKAMKPALIIARLPSQHLHERRFLAEPASLPIEHLRADASRLVFHLAPAQLPLELSAIGLLQACAQSGLNVAAGAALPAGTPALGTTSGAVGARLLDPLETSLELPFRLAVSPNNAARFAHSLTPVASPRGRAELWHTRLAQPREQRTLRALDVLGTGWPGWDEPLHDQDRESIVASSSSFANPAIQVDRLALSALGAWFDGGLDLVGTSLVHWAQHSVMGRDVKVERVHLGRLSLCHRTALLETTERKFSSGTHPVAYLHTEYTMVVVEEVRQYHQPSLATDMATQQRQWPFRTVRMLTRRTPPLDPPLPGQLGLYQPAIDGVPVQWEVEAEDARGEMIRFTHALAWTPEEQTPPNVLPGARPAVLGGKRVALAPIADAGDPSRRDVTTLEVHNLTIETRPVTETLWGRYDARFAPVITAADVVIEALAATTGATGPVPVKYPTAYLDHGLNRPAGNPNDLFLQLAGAAQRADFVKSGTDKVGGLVAPNLDVAGLSRLTGPVTSALVVNPTDPVTADSLFPIPKNASNVTDVLDSFCPRLFGCISLKSILKAGNLDLDAMAPKFVTEALGELDRLRQIGKQLVERGGDLYRQADDAHRRIPVAELQAHAGKIRDFFTAGHATYVVGAVGDAVAKLEEVLAAADPDAFSSLEATQSIIHAGMARLQAVATCLADARTIKVIEYIPVEEAGSLLRTTRRIVCGMMDVLEHVDDVVDVLLDAAVHVARGRQLIKDKAVKIDWRPELEPVVEVPGVKLTFARQQRGKHDNLLLSIEARAKQRAGQQAGADVLCSLENFDLELLGMIGVDFKRLQFRQRMGQKPEIDVVFKDIRFIGALSFVDAIRRVLPLDGFSDPPAVKVDARGLDASYSLGLPAVAVGMFSLEQMKISARLLVPFLGDAISFRFAFSSRQDPFLVTYSALGGGGFFEIELTPQGLKSLIASVQFGAQLALNFGVVSGSLSVMGGFVYEMKPDTVDLYGFVRIRGACDVLGLVSASIELQVNLGYVAGKLKGKATLLIEVSLPFISRSVSVEVERTISGSNGDPPFVGLVLPVHHQDYCDAFAA